MQKVSSGTRSLFFIQIFSTLSFSVLYSTLVLYATKQLGMSDVAATSIAASFVAFNYALHLLGGFITGRLLSHRSLFLLGMILQVTGMILISFLTATFFYWGLSFYLAGSGLNVTCINCMLTQFFHPNDKRRERAFLWNYSGMNVGFLIGFVLSGFYEIEAEYSILFLITAISSFIAILILLGNWKNLSDKKTHFVEKAKKIRGKLRLYGFLLVLAVLISLKWLLDNPTFSNYLVLVAGVFMVFVIGYFAIRQQKKHAGEKIWAYLVLALASLVFWTLYTMAPMGLTLFIENNVDRDFFGLTIPPQWVFNINSIIIIVGGPSMSYLYKNLRKKGFHFSLPLQFTIALFLIGVAFVLLPIGIKFANQQGFTNFWWIVASYILQSLGELFISPIGYAMIGQLIPHKLQGLMMGTWMMISGVGATIANIFSKLALGDSSSSDPLSTNASFSSVFNYLGWGAIIAAVIMLLLIKFLGKLIKEKKHPSETVPIPL